MGNMNTLQTLLDQEAEMSHNGLTKDHPFRKLVHAEIRSLRGQSCPSCFGYDDCSTETLRRCPWRMDCGESYVF